MRFLLTLLLTTLPLMVRAQGFSVSPSGFYDLPDGFMSLGGWQLRAEDARFGGLSALQLDPDGRLLALSDHGHLIELGFAGSMISDMGLAVPDSLTIETLDLLSTHQPPSHRRDAESLAYLDRGGDPRLYIGFERDHRIQRHFIDGRAEQRLAKPIALQNTYGNTGLEAVSGLPDTCLFAITEGVRRQGGLRAFKYCGGTNWPTRVYMPSADGFAPTAADLSPDGQHVYLIERKFEGLLSGFRARLVRVSVADINADIPLVPEVVLNLSDHMIATWNIEGLTLMEGADGRLVALMATDDNYQAFLPSTILAIAIER